MKDQQLIRRFLFFFDLCLIWLTAGGVYEVFGANRWAISSPAAVKLFSSRAIGFVFLLSILTTILAQLNGLYSSPCKRQLGKELRLLGEAVACAGGIAITCFYLLGINLRQMSPYILTVVLTWIPLAAWRKFIYSQSISGLGETRNVLILGCSKYGQLLREHLDQHPELGYVFKGYVDRRRGGRPPDPARNKVEAEILGPADQLPAIVRKHFIDEIFASVPSDRNLVMEVAYYSRSAGVPLRARAASDDDAAQAGDPHGAACVQAACRYHRCSGGPGDVVAFPDARRRSHRAGFRWAHFFPVAARR